MLLKEWLAINSFCFKTLYGAQGRNRTTDTVIFSHVLYQLSYLGVAGVLRGPGVIVERRSDCPAAVAANRGSGLKLTSVNGWLFACCNLRASNCVLQIACFKKSWLGKFEPDDKWIFRLKAARIRLCALASEAINTRRSHRPTR
jgi:hypothetical protein